MSLLACSALAYLITRLGYYSRTRSHRRATRAELSQPFERSAPSLTVLVPSYQEDERVIRMTLLSAALQEYPDLARRAAHRRPAGAQATPSPPRCSPPRSALPGEIEALLAVPLARFERALGRLRRRSFKTAGEPDASPTSPTSPATTSSPPTGWRRTPPTTRSSTTPTASSSSTSCAALAADLTTIAEALRAAAADGAALDRRPPALPAPAPDVDLRRRDHQLRAQAVRVAVARAQQGDEPEQLHRAHGRQLPGGRRPRRRPRAAAPDGVPDLEVPDPDYVLTLDADSVLLPEYCLRIVHLLEQAEHERVAVAQTPYTAFPGSATRIERIAGATTDLQHIVHQGMTHYDATFWVGANAILRKRALDDIARSPTTATGRSAATSRTARSSRTPSRPSTSASTAGRCSTTPSAWLQRHAAGLRLAVHPAPALGQRRPADPAAPVAARSGPAATAASATASARCSCASTTWRRSSGARSP